MQKLQHTLDTHKISNRASQDFCCLVLRNHNYYTYSLYESTYNHILGLFVYLIEYICAIERTRNMCPIPYTSLSLWGGQNVLDCKLSLKNILIAYIIVRHSDNSRILSSQNVCSNVVEIYQSICNILMTLTTDLYRVHILYIYHQLVDVKHKIWVECHRLKSISGQ